MLNLSSSRSNRIQALRAEVQALVPGGRPGAARLGFAVDAIDCRLAGGGLARAALHEVAGASPAYGDDAAASLFVAGIAARSSQAASVLWVMARTDLFAPGLSQAGLKPDRLMQVEARTDQETLAVVEEGLRHGALSAVIGEVGAIGLTATRRLQLAAEEGGTMALLLRRWRRTGRDPIVEPSAAVTRWRIGCAPSTPLPVAGVGRPQWHVGLVRQRGGDPNFWIMEGCDAQGCLALPAESRDRSASADRRGKRQAA
ncbi:ImuA family protein [Sphingomonas sp. AP4-R1]|uniref:ImuA family protein n=1 Tax=Sphingomonas sp. AP4-R1 TaxID=2735134 RepID=UPI0020A44D9E|nr:protein ImuA [Sphingomonas sp. AP4-R1]